MAGLLDALLGAGDADVGAGVVRAWNSDLGGGLQLQLLQLLAVLTDDKTVVLLGDGDRSRGLSGREAVSKEIIGSVCVILGTDLNGMKSIFKVQIYP